MNRRGVEKAHSASLHSLFQHKYCNFLCVYHVLTHFVYNVTLDTMVAPTMSFMILRRGDSRIARLLFAVCVRFFGMSRAPSPTKNFNMHRRGDSRIARFFVCGMHLFLRSGGSKPPPYCTKIHTLNSLNEQGLGGPCELARAKASVGLRRLSVGALRICFDNPLVSKFLRGCGGTSRKKFPHINPYLTILSNGQSLFVSTGKRRKEKRNAWSLSRHLGRSSGPQELEPMPLWR